MLSKAEAGYREPDNRYPCMLCRHFEAYLGTCSMVEGAIRPVATCDHWRAVEDKGARRCDVAGVSRRGARASVITIALCGVVLMLAGCERPGGTCVGNNSGGLCSGVVRLNW